MGNLTKNFSTWEFACKCCGHHPPPGELRPIAEALQQLRDHIEVDRGEIPIHLNCGYRCPKHNREIKGSKTSRHMLGMAADCVATPLTPIELAQYALQIPAFEQSGIGLYDTFVHLDIGRSRRWRRQTIPALTADD